MIIIYITNFRFISEINFFDSELKLGIVKLY